MSGRNNSGTLGANKRRRNDSDPSHQGQATIDGKEYWISAWVKENRETGERFFGMSFRPKMASEHRGAPRNPPPRTAGQAPNRPRDEYDEPSPQPGRMPF